MAFQHELLKSMHLHADKTAIEQDDRQTSFAALLETSDRITGFLLGQGYGKETVIAILLPDRMDLIGAIIGVLHAGCVFVPLDGSLPESRRADMLRDLQPACILCSSSSRMPAPPAGHEGPALPSYFIEDILEDRDGADRRVLQYPDYDEADSIYIYFTSGSTGRPKGIVGRNGSLLQFLQWEIDEFGISPGCRVSQFISPYFDAFLRDVFVPLLSGGTICLPSSEADFFVPEKLIAWIDRKRIHLIHCVPSLFRVIGSHTLTADHFRDLRHVLLSGERIIPAELSGWYGVFGSRIELVNLYGTTETTMIRFFYRIRPEDTGKSRIPVGTPIRDTEFLVAGKNMQPCSTLVAGDLYIISDFFTKGYLNDPELTHEKFIRIPVNTPDGKMAFATGDTARVLKDGTLDLIGRSDRQIKLRGIRIEPEEIEAALLGSGLVKNTVVIKRADTTGEESLIAFLIRADGVGAAVDLEKNVRMELESRLPVYMIPSQLVEVDAFPLLSNGKLNYQELLHSLRTGAIDLPENEMEEKLQAIWRQILGDKQLSTTWNFFRIGGNSLSIMRLIGIIYKEFNIRISLSQLFNHNTIREQAVLIRQLDIRVPDLIPVSAIQPSYHLSSAQEVFFNRERNEPGRVPRLSMVWEFPEVLDAARLAAAFGMLVQRHEILRTRYAAGDGEALQVVEPSSDIAANGERAIDPERGIVMGYEILPADGEGFSCRVYVHPIACDAFSLALLYADMRQLYTGTIPPPLPLQYKDYAEWEVRRRSTARFVAEREFWLREFDGQIPVLNVPLKYPEIVPGRKWDACFQMDRSVPESIMAADGTPPALSSSLFAAYILYLSCLTRQDDLVAGMGLTGRLQETLAGLAGPFEKVLPIRYRIDADRSFREMMSDLQAYLTRADAMQSYDQRQVIDELNIDRKIPVKSLADALFFFRRSSDPGPDIQTMNPIMGEYKDRPDGYPIFLMTEAHEDHLVFRFACSAMYFSKQQAGAISAQFRSFVKMIFSDPDEKIGRYRNIFNSLPARINVEHELHQ